jgi:hypothetical protein
MGPSDLGVPAFRDISIMQAPGSMEDRFFDPASACFFSVVKKNPTPKALNFVL